MFQMRHNLTGQQFHALAGKIMGQSSGLAAGQENAAAQFFQMLFEFLANSGRAAHDGEDALFDVIPGFLL